MAEDSPAVSVMRLLMRDGTLQKLSHSFTFTSLLHVRHSWTG